ERTERTRGDKQDPRRGRVRMRGSGRLWTDPDRRGRRLLILLQPTAERETADRLVDGPSGGDARHVSGFRGPGVASWLSRSAVSGRCKSFRSARGRTVGDASAPFI